MITFNSYCRAQQRSRVFSCLQLSLFLAVCSLVVLQGEVGYPLWI